MKGTFQVMAGLALVLVLLLGLGALTVFAQGPAGTPTPAQAPPAAAAGVNLDDPARAAPVGNAVPSIPANTAEWFRFDYVTPIDEFPRNMVTVRMLNGVSNGLGFEIWSPERMQGNWWENQPVGRGTQEVLAGCTTTQPDGTTAKCTSNDLTWVGGFGVSAPYYIRIVNNTNSAVAPQLIVSGNGVAQCQNLASAQIIAQPPAAATNQGFLMIGCPTASGTLVPVSAAAQGATTTPSTAETPAAAASPTAAATSSPASAPTLAPTETPAAAATVAPTSAATAAATTAATATSVATAAATSAATATSATGGTPSGAPSVTPAAGATSGAGAMPEVAGLAVAQNASIGSYVTDSQGRTLYAFMRDTGTTSNCTGPCAQIWPPATASGTPQAGTGIDASKLGTSTRSDGSTQLTYNGHPLYYFSGDSKPGDTNGQGVLGIWFTLSPSGDFNQTGGAAGTGTPGAAATSAPSGAATSAPASAATPYATP